MHKFISVLIALAALFSASTATAQEEFKRNLEQVNFVPKGQWITGVSVSYSQSNQDNYQFFILEGLSGDTYNFKVSPMLLFSFKDNLAAGGRFSFERSRYKIDGGDLKLDSETDYNIDHIYSVSNSYYVAGAFRNYISLGRSTRFGFYNEVQLQLGGGQSKLCNGSGDDLTGTYSKNFSVNVELAPGFIMFLNNYSAIEVNVGVLGFTYKHTKSTKDQIYVSNLKTQKANFKIDLFSISFGVAFYL